MEIDRVLLSPVQRRVEGRRRTARLRWPTAARHSSAVIDEAADGAR